MQLSYKVEGYRTMLPTPIETNQIAKIPLGCISQMTNQGINAGGLLRWRGSDLKSPLVLESIKHELVLFSKSTQNKKSLEDLWALFIYQY